MRPGGRTSPWSLFLVARIEARAFGVLTMDPEIRLTEFTEEPQRPAAMPGHPGLTLVSMGNYHFRPDLLMKVLKADGARETIHNFAQDIISALISTCQVYAYDFCHNRMAGTLPGEDPAYWRDVGTIEAYFEAHMELTGERPPVSLRNQR